MPPVLVYSLVQRPAVFWSQVQAASSVLLEVACPEVPASRWTRQPDILITGRLDEPAGGVRLDASFIGRVVLGQAGRDPDAVFLPSDVTARELALALSLLARTVQLQRQQLADRTRRQRLERLALRDPLTGLPNRRAWNQQLRSPLHRRRTDRWCVALMDLDRFKGVNSRYGHVTGDRVLRVVGRALARNLRDTDFAARLGGDEFGLLLADVLADDAPEVLERLRDQIRQALCQRDLPPLTGSIGWTMLDGAQACCARRTLQEISDRLRRAKQSRRGRVVGAAALA